MTLTGSLTHSNCRRPAVRLPLARSAPGRICSGPARYADGPPDPLEENAGTAEIRLGGEASRCKNASSLSAAQRTA